MKVNELIIFRIIFSCCFFIFLHSSILASQIIALEGMPGAGKTTALVNLAQALEGQCIVLSEVNPEPGSDWLDKPNEELPEFYHQYWIERIKLLKSELCNQYCFLLDRSYLGNLACVYALDKFLGTNFYTCRKEYVERDFKLRSDFDLIIILDVIPEVSIARKQKANLMDPWPWSKKDPWPWNQYLFLELLREFYTIELPKIMNGKIVFIKTDQLTRKELFNDLFHLINSTFDLREETLLSKVCGDNHKKLLKYAEENQLGHPLSGPVMVLGYPTVYFDKHSLQLNHSGEPVFFNNKRVLEVIREH